MVEEAGEGGDVGGGVVGGGRVMEKRGLAACWKRDSRAMVCCALDEGPPAIRSFGVARVESGEAISKC